MVLLAFLRHCSYWLFLVCAVSYVTVTLLLMHGYDATAALFHPILLYGTLASLLLTLCFSVTLWVNRPQEGQELPTLHSSTLPLSLSASLLVALMIAALLFFL